MKINDLSEENKKLKLDNLDVSKYKEWSRDELIYWIISIDKEVYGQYEQILKTSLTEEEVRGDCIDDIDVSDIKRWGIKNFKHSKNLMKQIKLLIERQQNVNQNVAKANPILNEGANAPTAYI